MGDQTSLRSWLDGMQWSHNESDLNEEIGLGYDEIRRALNIVHG